MDKSDQFQKVRVVYTEPTPGFDLYFAIALYRNRHVLIGAPTLDELETAWRKLLTNASFDREGAQHGIITAFKAPEDVYQRAKDHLGKPGVTKVEIVGSTAQREVVK